MIQQYDENFPLAGKFTPFLLHIKSETNSLTLIDNN